MPRYSLPQPHPGSHRVTRKRPVSERTAEIAADPLKYADLQPARSRGRPRFDGARPVTLPALRFLGDEIK